MEYRKGETTFCISGIVFIVSSIVDASPCSFAREYAHVSVRASVRLRVCMCPCVKGESKER